MIKYFCDICGEEIPINNLYRYRLPTRTKKTEYEPTWSGSKGSTRALTREIIEDQCLMICEKCRKDIAYAIDKEKS